MTSGSGSHPALVLAPETGSRSEGSGLGRGASGAARPPNGPVWHPHAHLPAGSQTLGSWPECRVPCLESAPGLVSSACPAVRLVPRASCCHVPSPVAPAVLPSALGGGPPTPGSKKAPPLPARVAPSPAVASCRRGGRRRGRVLCSSPTWFQHTPVCGT